ncbi:MAG: TerB family tellurite resistance protein [Gemmatimonadota bacterium]|nr:TerB family tellurite resistance protein [Gemmatimonadota bacterium]
MVPVSQEDTIDDAEVRLAACALLIEIAHADEDFTEDERQHLASAIRRQYGLDGEQAEELISLAEEAQSTAVDLWQFTKLIKSTYSIGQKMVLLEVMWGLVYSDGELSSHEESLMRRVCGLLDLAPGFLADVRKRVQGTGDEGEGRDVGRD